MPIPAVKSATDGSMPTNSGTSTVAPNATNRNCAPTMVFFSGLSFVVSVASAGRRMVAFSVLRSAVFFFDGCFLYYCSILFKLLNGSR